LVDFASKRLIFPFGYRPPNIRAQNERPFDLSDGAIGFLLSALGFAADVLFDPALTGFLPAPDFFVVDLAAFAFGDRFEAFKSF
jgi:hypothetical protein